MLFRSVLQAIVQRWNAEAEEPEGLRRRVDRSVGVRTERRVRELVADLAARLDSDLSRVDGTFQRFEQTLTRSLARMKQEAREAEETLFEPDGSAAQRRRVIREVQRRLDVLAEERSREQIAVRARYAHPVPHVFIGALVLALTPDDAEVAA